MPDRRHCWRFAVTIEISRCSWLLVAFWPATRVTPGWRIDRTSAALSTGVSTTRWRCSTSGGPTLSCSPGGSNNEGAARATVGRRLSTVAGFYRYCVEEELLTHNPAANVRRPRLRHEATISGLDRNELGAFLVQAGLSSSRDHALACLLALNGLRVSEALDADIEDLGLERGHHTLLVRRKGGKTVLVPLAPRTARTVYLAVGERPEGPIFTTDEGRRMNRHQATRMVRRLAKRAGIDKKISLHSLRHSFITAALDAGVPLRDVQEAASHADPRTTMRYDRARQSLDRHATYIVATFVAGASR